MEDRLFDACGKRVMIRQSGIAKLDQFINGNLRRSERQSCRKRHYDSSITFLKEVILRVSTEEGKDVKTTTELFVDDTSGKEVICATSDIYPAKKIPFIYYVVLTLGKYETELDVFEGIKTFKESFERAGLVEDCLNVTLNETNAVYKRYVDEQCLHLPVTKTRLEHLIKLAENIISNVLRGDEDVLGCSIQITELSIRDHASDDLRHVETDMRKTLAVTLHGALAIAGVKILPPPDKVYTSSLLNPVKRWIPMSESAENVLDTIAEFLPHTTSQSDSSITEQALILMKAYSSVLQLKQCDPSVMRNKFPLIWGPPGCGKTFLVQLLTYAALSEGLRVCLLSLTSERARALGGTHIHQLFPIKVSKGQPEAPSRTYSHLIQSLKKDPRKMVILQRIDVFVFEEIGMVSAELYGISDSAMREIMRNDKPFGNKLVIANGDPCQLSPPQERSFWASTRLSSFESYPLKAYVRSASDIHLQKIVTLMREPAIAPQEIDYIVQTLVEKCNFPIDWSGVPENVMRVVSTRKAEQAVIKDYINYKRKDPDVLMAWHQSWRWLECSGWVSHLQNKQIGPGATGIGYFQRLCFTYDI